MEVVENGPLDDNFSYKKVVVTVVVHVHDNFRECSFFFII